MHPVIRHFQDSSWVFTIILVIGLLFVFIKLAFRNTYSALDNITTFKEIEENLIPFTFLINLMMGCLLSIFLYPFLHIPHFATHKVWLSVCFLMFIFSVFVLLKFLINTLIIYISNEKKEFRNIMRGKIYYRVYWVIILCLCNLLLYYSGINQIYLFYTVLALSAILLLIEYYQQLNHGKLYKYINSYYFILYLCILEIFPILYIYNHWYR